MIKIEALWNKYKDENLMKRCEKYALWTIPSLFPKRWLRVANQNGNIPVEHDYQSIGAMLVNSAAPKITSLLFPVRQPFFRVDITDKSKQAFKDVMSKQGMKLDDKGLQSLSSDIERQACIQMFKNASYAALQRFVSLLIVTGNALLYRTKEQGMIVYSLHNYAVKRDGAGAILCIILREYVAFSSLPVEIQQQINTTGRYKPEDEVTLYTKVERVVGTKTTYHVTQEISGNAVGGTDVYPENLCPYIPVYWEIADGDSYGTGQVEKFAGDFAKLSDLSKALTFYELEACNIINLVKPGATTDMKALNEAVIGQYVQGNPQDIAKHESGEYQKIQQLTNSLTVIFQRLAPVFMYKANVRDAERVTKEEIRAGAEEVDNLMGGVYSAVSTQLHTRLAYLGTVETFPEFEATLSTDGFQFEILVGLAALGRSAELNLLTQAAQVVTAIVPPLLQVNPRFDGDRIIDTIFQSFGLNIADYTYTLEELQEQQKVNQATMASANPLDQVNAIQGVIGG